MFIHFIDVAHMLCNGLLVFRYSLILCSISMANVTSIFYEFILRFMQLNCASFISTCCFRILLSRGEHSMEKRREMEKSRENCFFFWFQWNVNICLRNFSNGTNLSVSISLTPHNSNDFPSFFVFVYFYRTNAAFTRLQKCIIFTA